jgi:hypothetical protein
MTLGVSESHFVAVVAVVAVMSVGYELRMKKQLSWECNFCFFDACGDSLGFSVAKEI